MLSRGAANGVPSLGKRFREDFESVSLDSARDPSLRLKIGSGRDDADEHLVDSVLLLCH